MNQDELARYLSSHEQAEQLFAEFYPGMVRELASLTRQTPEQVESIADYICKTRPGRNKYLVVDDLLTFHRIASSESQASA